MDHVPDSMLSFMASLGRGFDAINLSSGFPDFPAPSELKVAAAMAVERDMNQYSRSQGTMRLCAALAEKFKSFNGLDADPEREITVTCGAAEAIAAAVFSVVNPGDEVIIIEPVFESYAPSVIMAGGVPRFLSLAPPLWEIDFERLSMLFNGRTKLMILNTPHNPTGRIFTREELDRIRDLCLRWDAYLVCDEIYERITFDGRSHVSPASLPDMYERTVTVGGFSKTYSVTGWRLGCCCAPSSLTEKIRRVHVYLTVCAPTPLQEGALAALALPEEYYGELRNAYGRRRDILAEALAAFGLEVFVPEGSCFIMADFSSISREDDETFCVRLARDAGVTAAPGSSFFPGSGGGGTLLRFAFCRREETLHEAGRRLAAWRGRGYGARE